MSDASESNRKAVYTITEQQNGGKSRWVRVGIAFVNRDGSLNLVLERTVIRCDSCGSAFTLG